ncbi:hemolysin family protein [Candidatus Magnetominusculus xianensis]|uniref:Transporter n=1 Tax=Candidatus Magnetominusculus xianensis TaxID=1748249 RepID=A0ABR5SFR4_9BACT|nr:hemolysin family protein [Candidatus Magnetominusculus xianensis]KWT86762.1 transporter [Candidatus Magnetominusculus xianensis]MBF0402519.1 HlyC/CorC family transporter [Nitrospirota bacterium]
MWLNLILILAFIFFSGLFAASEIAVITARKSIIETFLKEGSTNAKALLELKENPDRFLATVQIGVTIGSAVSSTLGGAMAVEVFKPLIASIPFKYISVSAEPIAIALVVAVIGYFSLILGELVPKTIALMYPERIALLAARPITYFSRISSVIVGILTKSANVILRPFGKTAFTQRAYISHEEIKLLIKEGKDRGIFEPAEQELIHSVFEFTDISVKEVMVPTGRVVTISLDEPLEDVLRLISEEQYSRYPVYNKELNNIKGILHAKDVFKLLTQNREIIIRKVLRPPFYVPETMMISHLLSEMQKKHTHMAIAVNEHGTVTGIVTIEDLLEEIVGEIRDEHDTERPVISIGLGVYIIYASINIRDLKEDFNIEIPESPQYDTLGGFVVTHLQKIPEGGEIIELDGMKITILEMVHTRVAKVKVEILEQENLIMVENAINGEKE